MNNRIKKIDSLKYRLEIANHQWKTKTINDGEYNDILNIIEKELRTLEDEIFSDIETNDSERRQKYEFY